MSARSYNPLLNSTPSRADALRRLVAVAAEWHIREEIARRESAKAPAPTNDRRPEARVP